MRKFSLLQILVILAGLFAFVFIVNGLLSSNQAVRNGDDTSYLPSVSPEVQSCIAQERSRVNYDSRRVVVQFYPVESNIEKANALFRDLGFPNKLGAVAGKTDEVWLSVVRDDSNILEELFLGDKEAYENYVSGGLRRADPDASFAVDRRIHEADERLLKLIEQEHGDRWDSINTRSFGVPTYIVRLGVHMTLEEVRDRFGGNSQIEVDYNGTFYNDPIDFMVFLNVGKGQEIGWGCYLRVEHSDLVGHVNVEIPVVPY